MATDFRKIVTDELNVIAQKIISQQNALGLRDSGTSASSFRILGATSGKIAMQFVRYLQTNFSLIGTKPRGIGQNLITGLLNWGKLQPRDNQTQLQAAFAVATTLVAKGSLIKRGRKRGIRINKIMKDSANRLSKDLADNELDRAIGIIDEIKPQ